MQGSSIQISEISGRGHLLRVLGLGFGLAVGLGSVVGAGVLRTPGSVLDEVPIPFIAIMLWAFAAVHAMLTANIVAEVMTGVPKAGGLFNVAQRAFGNFGALLVGWTDWLFNVAGIAALSIASAEFLAVIFPGLRAHSGSVAVGIVLVLFAINWAGVREGSVAQMVTSALKASLLLALIGLILFAGPQVEAAGPSSASGNNQVVGWTAVVAAYGLIFGAFGGWIGPAYFAEEDTNPGRNIPRALFGSLLAVTAIYLLMNMVLFHALPVEKMRTSELPVALAIGNVFGEASVAIVAGVAFMAVIGTINAIIMISPRIIYGLGRDGYLPSVTSHVNRGGTPDVAMALTAILSVLLALTGEFETVFRIGGALGLSILVITGAAFFKLRLSEPDLPRPYQAKGYPWLPAAALALDFAVLAAFLAANLRSAVYIAAAIALCIPLSMAGRCKSRVAHAT